MFYIYNNFNIYKIFQIDYRIRLKKTKRKMQNSVGSKYKNDLTMCTDTLYTPKKQIINNNI